MNKHILLTLVAMSSVALNGMDVPRSSSLLNPATQVVIPLTEEQALSMAIALSQRDEQERQRDQQIADKELELATVLSRQDGREQSNWPSHAEGFNTLANGSAQPAKQYDLTNPGHVSVWANNQGIPMTWEEALAFAAQQKNQQLKQQSRAESIKAQVSQPAKQYDLTNPHDVIAWAKGQGITMTFDEALTFAFEQRDQLAIQQVTASLESNDNAPKPAQKANAVSEEIKEPAKKADSEVTVDDCPICLEPLEKDVVPVGPNCKHKIHSACLATIKTKFTECPECRAII